MNGFFFKIHNELGRFCQEQQYADAFETTLLKENFNFLREKKINKLFLGEKINFGIPDFIIENRIVVDFKAKKFITKDDYFQMMRYLKSKNFKLGLIVNFRNTYLKPKRIVN
ncbi:MAG: hypothetical protein COU85_00545 [Candidatus Portnoybacteria bacterium CG10_big_fil_rev_8_21_14_0_10_44_7]|uniref:GxxExxY protein n=1 Tax=Candidatus Portnoybacteria bacterium CG10_big_fil_rev_8_21_14_0_10_44_7 TaxID=1974816 RepID=A0A2M8KJC2_9BACT|nr:MAG: hypothetical protein COU85_00545 [Candidatus Portnoybacteria bacterium CG10_big_fil_rev_8_21_14_0_10_44_7]